MAIFHLSLSCVLILVLIIIIILIFLYCLYIGCFRKIEIKEKTIGPFDIIYEEFAGRIITIGKAFGNMEKEIKKYLPTQKNSLGIYYDLPGNFSYCRAIMGFPIPENADVNKIKELCAQKKYKTISLPQINTLFGEFPLKNVSSYFFGPPKVLPPLQKKYDESIKNQLIKYKRLWIEIYDHDRNMICFHKLVGDEKDLENYFLSTAQEPGTKKKL